MKIKLIVIALVLIAVGFVTGCVAVGISGGNFFVSNKTTNTYTVEESFGNILINDDTGDILVKKSNDGICRIECVESENIKYSVKVEDGALSIEKNDSRKWYEMVEFNFDIDDTIELVISLPEGWCEDITLDSSTSDLKLEEGITCKNININLSTGNITSYAKASESFIATVSTGDVQVFGADSKIITLRTGSGNILLENISASTEINATANTGDLRIAEVNSGKITVKTSTGEQVLKYITCESITAESSTGDKYFTSVTASGDIKLISDTGDVRFEEISARNLTVTTSSGSQKYTDTKLSENLNLTAGTGDISLDGVDAAEIKIKTTTGEVKGSLLTPKICYVKTSTGDLEYPRSNEGGFCEIETTTGDVHITFAD